MTIQILVSVEYEKRVHVAEINHKLGKQVLFVVPMGQAVIALREKIIAGQARSNSVTVCPAATVP
jgi:hypothetical protein